MVQEIVCGLIDNIPSLLVQDTLYQLIDDCPSLVESYKTSQKLGIADLSFMCGSPDPFSVNPVGLNTGSQARETNTPLLSGACSSDGDLEQVECNITAENPFSVNPVDLSTGSNAKETNLPPLSGTCNSDGGLEQVQCIITAENHDPPINSPEGIVDLDEWLKFRSLKRLPVKGDGLCMLRAIASALTFVTHKPHTLSDVSKSLSLEAIKYHNEYSPFMEDSSNDLVSQVKLYLAGKQYTLDAADLYLHMLANAYTVCIQIVTKNNNQYSVQLLPPSRRDGFSIGSMPIVTILRTGMEGRTQKDRDINNHYDPLVLLKDKPYDIRSSTAGEWDLYEQDKRSCILFKYPSLLSNLSPVGNYMVDKVKYTGVEQFFQSQKFDKDQPIYTKIINTTNPFTQMKLGKCRYRRNWTPKREKEVMRKGLWAKYSKPGPHRDYLLSTGDCFLAEATPHPIWGIGIDMLNTPLSIASHRSAWVGENKLGQALMQVRSDLRRDRLEPSPGVHVIENPNVAVDSFSPKDQTVPGPQISSSPVRSKTKTTASTPPLYTDVIKSPNPRVIVTTPKKHERVLLSPKGMYIPPNHMSANYVLNKVREVHPTLGHRLEIVKGKLTSKFPDVQHALKLPLLPLSSVPCLRNPLPRALPENTCKQIWLTEPIALNPFNPLLLAASPEVVSITKYESDGDRAIFKVLTGFVSVGPKQVQPTRKVIELKGGQCIQLTKFSPIERCTSCQSLDHNKWQCAIEYFTCVFCAGHHFSGRCPSKFNYKCGRCKGPHKASSFMCPEYRERLEEQKLPSLGNNPNCANHNNKQATPLLESNFSEARVRTLFSGNQLIRFQKLFSYKPRSSYLTPSPKSPIPTPLMEVKLSEERIMSIFGHVSPQFHGFAPFSIELGSKGDIAQNQPSGIATLSRPLEHLENVAYDIFDDGHLNTVVSLLSGMCENKAGTITQYRHIIQNPDIMKLFQEASPEFIKETILPVLKDACNSLSSKNNNSVQHQRNPNLIYIKTTDKVPSIPIYKNPNLIHIDTSN